MMISQNGVENICRTTAHNAMFSAQHQVFVRAFVPLLRDRQTVESREKMREKGEITCNRGPLADWKLDWSPGLTPGAHDL